MLPLKTPIYMHRNKDMLELCKWLVLRPIASSAEFLINLDTKGNLGSVPR